MQHTVFNLGFNLSASKKRIQLLSVRDFRLQWVKFYSSYYICSRLEYSITLNVFVLSSFIYSYRENMRAPRARANNCTFRCLYSALENALEKVKVRFLRKSVREKNALIFWEWVILKNSAWKLTKRTLIEHWTRLNTEHITKHLSCSQSLSLVQTLKHADGLFWSVPLWTS